MKTEYVIKCENCGSANVQTKVWVMANTDEIVDQVEPTEFWCNDCTGPTDCGETKDIYEVRGYMTSFV